MAHLVDLCYNPELIGEAGLGGKEPRCQEGNGVFCPNCGSENLNEQPYCVNCGFQLKQPVSRGTGSLDTGSSFDHYTEANLLQKVVSGRYNIIRELGRGGFGMVFEAMDIRLGRTVAIKTMLLAHANDPVLVSRFLNEARISASLDHPNIVRIFTTDSEPPVHYFVMEYIPGPTLKQLIAQQSSISPFQTLKLCRDIVRALNYAHCKGIIHRDVNPRNIILKHNEKPVITDFGIAKALSDESTHKTTSALGSPHYISPEQLLNESIDSRTDQYSVGIMMYEMLTGSPPFCGNGYSIANKHLHEKIPAIQSINPNVSEELARVIDRLLQKDRADRFATTQDLLDALERMDLLKQSRQVMDHDTDIIPVQQSVSEIIRSAMQALEHREFDKMIGLVESGRQIDKDHPELLILLNEANRRKEAISQREEHINLGIEKFLSRHFEESIESLNRALDFDSNNSEILMLIAKVQEFSKLYYYARDLYEEGQQLFKNRRFAEALNQLKAVRDMDISFPNLTSMIAAAELELKAVEEEQQNTKSVSEEVTSDLTNLKKAIRAREGKKEDTLVVPSAPADDDKKASSAPVVTPESSGSDLIDAPASPPGRRLYLVGILVCLAFLSGWWILHRITGKTDTAHKSDPIIATQIPTSTLHVPYTPGPTSTQSLILQPTRTPTDQQRRIQQLLKEAQIAFHDRAYRNASVLLETIKSIEPEEPAMKLLKKQVDEKLKEANDLLREARRLYGEKKYREADDYLDSLLASDPFNDAAKQLKVALDRKLTESENQQNGFTEKKPMVPSREKTAVAVNSPPEIVYLESIPSLLLRGKPVQFKARVRDREGLKSVTLYYRRKGDDTFANATNLISPKGRKEAEEYFSVPKDYITRKGLEVYLEVKDMDGLIGRDAGPSSPHFIRVK